ncbi:PREDICTED: uncharacterized protein LOC104736698 isoform X2 [Camelina sativa]|uniref:Uncharacterized protein LOC104736698 isoform X2 n=1 Tax=Camelina sativa TaxID=90675 RepID=A0ABM0VEN8_CAMSA|nr:PREDICTED: uncharacterized protein LOC104736698 isoform X2 [Camelina sativa]
MDQNRGKQNDGSSDRRQSFNLRSTPNLPYPISPEKMQQRKPTAGRPSGTDGSDFSYRMVVDSRYTKVTKEKARLRPLIFVQAVIYLIGVSCAFLTTTKKDEMNTLAIAGAAAGFVSSLIGELEMSRKEEGYQEVS